jgi:hypothetical protein
VKRWSIAPYFIVDDVVATANWYRDRLGFRYDRFWNDPPAFCMVYRSGVVIMLAQLEKPGLKRPNPYAEFKSKGVTIARDIRDEPYGCRDFDIEDGNGYRLCFGHDTGGSSP